MVGAFIIVAIGSRVAILIFNGLDSNHAYDPQSGLSASQVTAPLVTAPPPPIVPVQTVAGLRALLGTPPSSGFAIDSKFNQSQVDQPLAGGLPAGTPIYTVNWLGPTGQAVIESGMGFSSPMDEREFAQGASDAISTGTQSFAIPGLSTAAVGGAKPPRPGHKAEAIVTIARQQITVIVWAFAPTIDEAEALAIRAAHTAGSSLAPDNGTF